MKDSGNSIMDELQSAIYRLLKRFVSRQVLNLRAVEEMRPQFMVMARRDAPTEELLRAMQDQPDSPERGYTGDNNQWSYVFHGLGCRLTHTITQEVIDWDAPDVNAFDAWFFLKWLEWLLKYEADSEDAVIVQKAFDSHGGEFWDFVRERIQHLEEAGLIMQSEQYRNKYTLL